MDYKDYQAGVKPGDIFWFKGKVEFINFLLKKSNFNKHAKILNVGAGVGEDLHIISKYGDVYVVDIDENALNCIPNNLIIEKKLADVCFLPYEDNYFDLVIVFDVLEHIKNDKLAVKEIYRVLKRNGTFIFTVPAFNFLFCKRDEYLNHYRRYNKKNIKKLLKNFKCLSLKYWFSLLFLPAVLHLLVNKKYYIKNDSKVFRFINFICTKVLNIENWLISKGISFPFGLSIYGIYKK